MRKTNSDHIYQVVIEPAAGGTYLTSITMLREIAQKYGVRTKMTYNGTDIYFIPKDLEVWACTGLKKEYAGLYDCKEHFTSVGMTLRKFRLERPNAEVENLIDYCFNRSRDIYQGIPVLRALDGTHDSHCCQIHGCKYGEPECPVKSKRLNGIVCEQCQDGQDELVGLVHRYPELTREILQSIDNR